MSWIDEMFGNISRGVEDLTHGASTAFGNSMGNFFNGLGQQKAKPRNNGGYPFVDDFGRDPIEASKGPVQRQREQGDTDFRAILGGKYNSQPVQDPSVGVGTVLAGLNNNIDPSEISHENVMSPEDQRIADTIAALQQSLRDKYSYDGKYDKMVDSAFSGALGAVDKAEGRANANYRESDKFIDGLTDAHVNDIKTADREQVQTTGDNLLKDINSNYDGSIKSVQDDRAAEIAAQVEAMKRYGIDPSVLNGANDVKNETINRLQADKAMSVDQAKSNTAADLQLNTARASAQETDGIERRGELKRDLNSILGELDNSRAGIQSSIAQAKLQGQQADQAAFNDAKRIDAETLAMYMQNGREDRKLADERAFRERELALKQKQAGTGTAGDVAADRVRQMNIDPAPIEQAYYDAVSSNQYNSNTGENMKAWIMHEMLKRLGQVDPETKAAIGKYVDIKEGYGTDKANALIQ